MATTTLKTVYDSMHYFNRFAAPGSECVAWGDFIANCYDRYEMAPWDERAEEVEPVQDFVDYWLGVAEQRAGSEYDEQGNRKELDL